MRRYFAIGFVAFYAAISCPYGAAFARGASGVAEPSVAGAAHAWLEEHGVASYYGPGWNGRISASGLRFDQRLLTAAHPWLPFGTRVKVTLGDSTRSVVVVITDRLVSRRRIVDLSVAAAQELGILHRGLARVTLAPA
jgi:rare lipoprotein A